MVSVDSHFIFVNISVRLVPYTGKKITNLFNVHEDSIEQCCTAYIVQCCQGYRIMCLALRQRVQTVPKHSCLITGHAYETTSDSDVFKLRLKNVKNIKNCEKSLCKSG